MTDTRIKLSGLVRPYYGGSRLASTVREDAKLASSAETATQAAPAEAAPPARSAPRASSPRPPAKARPNPRDPVHQAATAAGWAVLEMGEELQVDVPTGSDRSQIVTARFDRRDAEGRPLLTFASVCGPLDERNAVPLLRYNAKLPHGAFVVETRANKEDMVVLRATVFAASGQPAEVRSIISEIAHRADKVEGKLTGRDQF